MKIPRFSLRALFLAVTLCAICSGVCAYTGIVQQPTPGIGRGVYVVLGPVRVGAANWSRDEHGWQVGIWYLENKESIPLVFNGEYSPLWVVQF